MPRIGQSAPASAPPSAQPATPPATTSATPPSMLSKCEATRAARSLAEQLLDIVRGEYETLASDEARRKFVTLMHEGFARMCSPPPACISNSSDAERPAPESISNREQPQPTFDDPSLDDVRSLHDAINSLAEQIPSAGFKFAESVTAKASSILASAEERGFASDRQIEAMENMLSGLERWFR